MAALVNFGRKHAHRLFIGLLVLSVLQVLFGELGACHGSSVFSQDRL
jgi:hypothetical protein